MIERIEMNLEEEKKEGGLGGRGQEGSWNKSKPRMKSDSEGFLTDQKERKLKKPE